MYPSQQAIDIVDLPKDTELHNLVILDGTWPQAKAIYNNTLLLQSMIHVSMQQCNFLIAILTIETTCTSLN